MFYTALHIHTQKENRPQEYPKAFFFSELIASASAIYTF